MQLDSSGTEKQERRPLGVGTGKDMRTRTARRDEEVNTLEANRGAPFHVCLSCGDHDAQKKNLGEEKLDQRRKKMEARSKGD